MRLLTLFLSLSAAAAKNRLARAIDPPDLKYHLFPGLTRGLPLIGRGADDYFEVRLRHGGRASFAPTTEIRIIEAPGGSVLMARSTSSLGRAFGPLLLLIGASTLVALSIGALDPSTAVLTALALGVALMCVGAFATVIRRVEEPAIAEHLKSIFADVSKIEPNEGA